MEISINLDGLRTLVAIGASTIVILGGIATAANVICQRVERRILSLGERSATEALEGHEKKMHAAKEAAV